MFRSIKLHISFILILAFWTIVGMLSTAAAFVVILITLYLFFKKERYYEALFGFFFLLVLGDNLEDLFAFAKVVKPIYLIVMGGLTYINRQQLIPNLKIISRFTPFLVVALLCVAFSVVPNISIQKTVSYGILLYVIPTIFIGEYKRYGPQLLVDLVAFSFIFQLISI